MDTSLSTPHLLPDHYVYLPLVKLLMKQGFKIKSCDYEGLEAIHKAKETSWETGETFTQVRYVSLNRDDCGVWDWHYYIYDTTDDCPWLENHGSSNCVLEAVGHLYGSMFGD